MQSIFSHQYQLKMSVWKLNLCPCKCQYLIIVTQQKYSVIQRKPTYVPSNQRENDLINTK